MKWLLMIPLLVVTPAWGLEVLQQSVEHFKGQYLIRLELLVDAPADYVEASLLDFQHLPELNPAMSAVKVEEQDLKQKTWRVSSHIHSCFWFRCIDLDRLEVVSRPRTGLIQSVSLPDQSDFHTGFSQWVLQPSGEQTHVDFHSGFYPKTREIPVIGPMIARYVIRREALQTYQNIEQRYNQTHATR